MTVLFSDIRGFTNFSEKLPPTELAEVLNAYLSTMTRIVQQHRGTIDKYIGDAIMAFWNAPVDLPIMRRGRCRPHSKCRLRLCS
jgi:adenylate cyclase